MPNSKAGYLRLMGSYLFANGKAVLVSYPDPNVRNDDYRLQYNITYRGSGNEVVGNGSMLPEFGRTNQIAAICDVTFQRYGSSANCISSIPIAKPHPKCDRKVFPSQR